jgi:hypothetical protein
VLKIAASHEVVPVLGRQQAHQDIRLPFAKTVDERLVKNSPIMVTD